ncbi:MAG TPA: outer membrane beta-barrel protein [Candidatus Methylacidiphilales bacterium]
MNLRILTLAALSIPAASLLAQQQPDLSNLITMPEAGAGVSPLQQSEEYTKTEAQKKAESPKVFSVSVAAREQYDDNIYTSHDNKTSDFETILSPSFLFNYPMTDTLLSARYTFGATAYADRDKTFDTSHDLVLRANHTFSSRFSLDVRDRVHYDNQPEIDAGSTVNRVAGTYLNNTFSIQGTTTWTPKLSTVTSYTNDYFTYDDPSIASVNNRDTHTFQNDFRYSLSPTVTLVNGFSVNINNYEHKAFVPGGQLAFDPSIGFYLTPDQMISRDWNSYALYTGADWTLLPELTVGARAGGNYTTYSANNIDSAFSPYATAFVTWQTGAKSSVDFSYFHSVSPTDIGAYSSATSDALSLTGTYKFTPKLTGRVQGSYTMNLNEANTSVSQNVSDYHENTLGVTLSLGYDFTQYLNFNLGYSYTNVDADSIVSSYNRNQVSLGLTASF